MAFRNAGFDVNFATEVGKAPECDAKMLRGITQTLLVSHDRKHDTLTPETMPDINIGCKEYRRAAVRDHGDIRGV